LIMNEKMNSVHLGIMDNGTTNRAASSLVPSIIDRHYWIGGVPK